MARILLVDDDTNFTSATTALLRADDYEVHTAGTVRDAESSLKSSAFDLMLVDLSLPDGSGLELIRDDGPGAIIVTGHPSVESAIRAVRGPVLDYLVKPLDRSQLTKAIDQVLKSRGGGRERANPSRASRMIGSSGKMAALREAIASYGPTDATVLITGESGTGKELVAESLHRSRNPKAELVTINCGAIPTELISSELFGHEKGAFTGANARRAGAFERAKDGTVFLDEVGELPLDQQVALLRVLESRTVTRVGGSVRLPIQARVVAATNRDLEKQVRAGEFREDLYFRLMVLPISVPPLREHGEDIPELVEHFLRLHAEEYGTPETATPEVIERLRTYGWPGNVRELKHVLLRAAIVNRGKDKLDTLPDGLTRPLLLGGDSGELKPGMAIRDVERTLIQKTLEHFDGHRKETAEALGISLKTLYNRLREYDDEDKSDYST